MANYSSNAVFNGLGTFNIGVPNIGTYTLNGTITLPVLDQGASANSQVVVTIAINSGSTIYTGPAGAEGFFISPLVIASANSIINITLSSSAAVDQGLNKIKSTVQVSELT
jgi:hypothetical protein